MRLDSPSPRPSPQGEGERWNRLRQSGSSWSQCSMDITERLAKRIGCFLFFNRFLSLVLLLGVVGCSKSDADSSAKAVTSPKEAAEQVERAFQKATPEVKKTAEVASEAIRNNEYEKAVVSLVTIRSTPGITMDQGLAIHNAMVGLESKLINAIEAGDQNAKQAYEALKRAKKK